jgi:hypothetical protein
MSTQKTMVLEKRSLPLRKPTVSRRPQPRGTRPPNVTITCGQRYTVRTGGCHYEPIRRISMKSRGQTVYRDYDLSIEG